MKKITEKNKLVKRYRENAPMSELECALGTKKRGTGIYVLYKKDELYYIGKTKRSIRSRLRGHLADHHKGKWDSFSFYQVKKVPFIRDLEVLLLHIYKPKGNRDRGRFKSRYNLSKHKDYKRCLLTHKGIRV